MKCKKRIFWLCVINNKVNGKKIWYVFVCDVKRKERKLIFLLIVEN